MSTARPSVAARLWTGLRRHPSRLFVSGFAAFAVLWTVTEASLSLAPLVPEGSDKRWLLAGMVAGGVFWGLLRALPAAQVRFDVKSLHTTVQFAFGDIFARREMKVIPVNEFFDSTLGDHVSTRSLHGQFIARHFAEQQDLFERLVDADLKGVASQSIERASGRCSKYPLGTSARVKVSHEVYLLAAVAHTDIDTLKANVDVPDFWRALNGLWGAVRTRADGHAVAVPLVGGGLSGLGCGPK